MVDSISPTDPQPSDLGAQGAPKGIKAQLNTRTGKMVLAAIVLLVIAAGAGVGLYLFMSPGGGTGGTPPAPVTSGKPGSSAVASEAVLPPEERRETELSDTFTFRDIFVPTIKPRNPASLDTSGSSTTSDTGDGALAPDTLYLRSISTQDGQQVAEFVWNSTTFVVGEGDVLEGTPWEVVDIAGDTVVMLYGDSRVTLSVGQGVGK